MVKPLDFQLLFEESPDVLLVLLPDSPRFTAVAATNARLQSTRSTRQDTIGHGLFELFPDNPDDVTANGTANLRASLERVLATKAPDTMAVQKYDIPKSDGGFEVKYWSPRNLPVLSPSGEVLYILHRAVDVTELVRAGEQEQDMEREVLRRSRELDEANRQLRDANLKLSKLDEAKTAFFNNISHEFRTPLTLMLGPLADSLADTAQVMDDRQRARLTLAYDNALRLLKLVNALLDFARLEAGRLRGSFAATDVAALTADLAAVFQSAVDAAGLKLRLDCSTLSEPVWIDRDMWEKIIPNLMSNAFKFTLSGEIRVCVSETTTHALIEVSDTGVGIPAAELPHLFERFHRVEGATGRTHEGAGIGLALVRELVELHGGIIGARSELHRGSAFSIEIPKGSKHLPSDSLRHSGAASGPGGGANLNATAQATEARRWTGDARAQAAAHARQPQSRASLRPRVLVVDDNADLRNYMCDLLAPVYEIAAAADGQDALQHIAAAMPDIVVSDVMMPKMTGIELLAALRANPLTLTLPVILLSARAGEEACIEGLDAGSDDYLTKPFAAAELLARVRSLVELNAARRAWADELQRANKELDAFSYSVAHDLRAPLRLIDGFATMMQEEDAALLQTEGKRRLDMIRGAAQRMSQLIDDLLYLSRLNRGELNCAGFDLSALARSVAAAVEANHSGRLVEVRVQDGLQVHADPGLLRIVLENLLGNAWKFTSKRADACIEFGAEADGCTFFVRDNGAGFDMAYASRLFGAFQRLHSAADFPGTGIGLATVNRIITKHGGRIWAIGEPGRGATFMFALGTQGAAARAAA